MWRGGRRFSLSVAASFVWRCPSNCTVTPFPHPAHRTGLADLPHPALGQDLTPSRVTPSAVSEHFFGVDRLANLLALFAYCVCPELRPLPSIGITRLHRYYEPLRHPKAPGLSLAGVRLLNRLSTSRGFPCCVRFPLCTCCRHYPGAVTGCILCSCDSVGLCIGIFEDCSAFTHVTACTLVGSPEVIRYIEGFSHFVTSMTAPTTSGWSIFAGWDLHPLESAPPFTAHTRSCPSFRRINTLLL